MDTWVYIEKANIGYVITHISRKQEIPKGAINAKVISNDKRDTYIAHSNKLAKNNRQLDALISAMDRAHIALFWGLF